jgi:hypothetical protein
MKLLAALAILLFAAPGANTPTPDDARQALLDMMRSDQGKALGFFDEAVVKEMEKVAPKKREDGTHAWTAVYHLNLQKGTYTLFVHNNKPHLRPDHTGRLILAAVYEGTFEQKGARWTASLPKYKYTLLD